MNNNVKVLLGFTVGAAAGALTGLLMAPQSGKKTRKMISSESDKFKDTMGDMVADTLKEAKSKYNDLLEDYTDLSRKTISKAKEKAKMN